MLNVSCSQCGGIFKDYASNHRKYCSMLCRNLSKKGRVGFWRGKKRWEGEIHPSIGKPRLDMRGENNPNWNNGSTVENLKLRQTLEFKLWRRSVFERDSYTCVKCYQRGGELHADHIKPFALYPELRLAIDNGRTLCKSCHLKTNTWGGRTVKERKLLQC
jgi:5-methylcytosine-specific restriction endonuclease McrA